MLAALYTVYVLNCLFLILVVLLQAGRGGGLADMSGGGGAAAAFGSSGASTLLQKATVASATTFMVLSIVIAIMSGSSSRATQGNTDVPASAMGTETPVSGGESSGAGGSALDNEAPEEVEAAPAEGGSTDE